MVERVAEVFRSAIDPSLIIVLTPPGLPQADALVPEGCIGIPGGQTRQESVYLGLQHLQRAAAAAPDALVAVHDAARCLIEPELVRRAFAACAEHGAVSVAQPEANSLVHVGADELIAGELDRRGVWEVQTPQIFRFDLLLQAHSEAAPGTATDDASLVRRIHAVRIVSGNSLNFKITTSDDLRIAEAIVRRAG